MAPVEQTDSEFVVHTECEKCGSRDNAAVYTDGHTYCFGCGDWQGDGDGPQRVESVHNHKPLILLLLPLLFLLLLSLLSRQYSP